MKMLLLQHRILAYASLGATTLFVMTSTILYACLDYRYDNNGDLPFKRVTNSRKRDHLPLIVVDGSHDSEETQIAASQSQDNQDEWVESRELPMPQRQQNNKLQAPSLNQKQSSKTDNKGLSDPRSQSKHDGHGILSEKVNALRGRERKSAPLSRRELFQAMYPSEDLLRVQKSVNALRTQRPQSQPNMSYDVFHCPDRPPDGYPAMWPLVNNVLRNWKVDVTDIPSSIYQSLCIFDWEVDRESAEAYRQAEVPFVVTNHPDVMRTTERWNHPNYLKEMIGPKPQRNDHSKTNHLMFYRVFRGEKTPENWVEPTDEVQLTFEEWLERAEELQNYQGDQTKRDHWYFRLNANYKGINSYLYDELPMFIPQEDPTFFLVEPKKHPGLNCRGGTKGAIAESHFDVYRNFIVLLGGRRRYILNHPSECRNLELYPLDHPSARHSMVDWSNPPGANYTGPFSRALANEVVLQPGDALYLPDLWFHFIASLDINFQCNGRSGSYSGNDRYMVDCGFPLD